MRIAFLSVLTALMVPLGGFTADWPTHSGDHRRSAQTRESLSYPLHLHWVSEIDEPRRAWPDPARQDFWQRIHHVKPRITHDRAFHVAAVGDAVFYGTSGNDVLLCLEANRGDIRWSRTLDGPIRFAPTVWEGRVYIGSDDGRVYCFAADSGEELWRYSPVEERRMIPGNQRFISAWPVRTNVAIDDGIAYFAAGLFPNEGVYLCAVEADSGEPLWVQPLTVAPQGTLLLSDSRIYVQTGRAQPAVYAREDGSFIQQLGGSGGAYALLTDDAFIYGPGRYGVLEEFGNQQHDHLASFAGNHMIVDGTMSYLHTDTELSAIDRATLLKLRSLEAELRSQRDALTTKIRELGAQTGEAFDALQREIRDVQTRLGDIEQEKEACIRWTIPCALPHALIRAGDALIAGGAGEVAAFSVDRGEKLWSGSVDGIAYGLAVSQGRLIVSTDNGAVYAFASDMKDEVRRSPRHVHDISEYLADSVTDFPVLEWFENQPSLQKGYALLTLPQPPEVIYGLIDSSDLHLVLLAPDSETALKARTMATRIKAYGRRVHVLQWDEPTLPFAPLLFNLVVTNSLKRETLTGLKRMLRPHGGTIFVGHGMDGVEDSSWARPFVNGYDGEFASADSFITWTNGALAGEGAWTHLYANPANTASSGDTRIHPDVRVQWFGQPGPNPMVDRHLRSMSPLVLNGLGVIPGNDTVIAFDPYNGTTLWQQDIPGLTRVGIPYDSGSAAMDEQSVYLAVKENLLVLDRDHGHETQRIRAPGDGLHWGYVAVQGERLIGSGQRASASRSEQSRQAIDEQYTQFQPLVLSETLAGYTPGRDDPDWVYQRGRVLNTTLTLANNTLWFVESRNAAAMADTTGRMLLDDLLESGSWLVALNASDGSVVWETPFAFDGCRHILYLSYSEGMLVALGSDNNTEESRVWYTLYGFDAETGTKMWAQSHGNNRGGIGGNHGEQVHHPVITNGIVIAEPMAYDIRTGEPTHPAGVNEAWYMSGARGGCGTISASASCLFYRNSNPVIHPLDSTEEPSRLSLVNRTGCWINVIPAGGLVLMPEASSGCTCAFSIQTSIAYMPQ